VQPGDLVLIYTGRWKKKDRDGAWASDKLLAGLHVSCAGWLRQRDVAVLGCDGVSDVLPWGVEQVDEPIHLLMLYSMGVHLLDNLDLERLSAKAAELGRWEFLVTVAPLPIDGATGSPVNPIATF
jgi:kynurenine formamidase